MILYYPGGGLILLYSFTHYSEGNFDIIVEAFVESNSNFGLYVPGPTGLYYQVFVNFYPKEKAVLLRVDLFTSYYPGPGKFALSIFLYFWISSFIFIVAFLLNI